MLKATPVYTHTYTLMLIVYPRAHFSLAHCNSPLALSAPHRLLEYF